MVRNFCASSAGPHLIEPEISAEGAILATTLSVLRTIRPSKHFHDVRLEGFGLGVHPVVQRIFRIFNLTCRGQDRKNKQNHRCERPAPAGAEARRAPA